jgi:pimeloyl-ACP methyl ester carboxylesterase
MFGGAQVAAQRAIAGAAVTWALGCWLRSVKHSSEREEEAFWAGSARSAWRLFDETVAWGGNSPVGLLPQPVLSEKSVGKWRRPDHPGSRSYRVLKLPSGAFVQVWTKGLPNKAGQPTTVLIGSSPEALFGVFDALPADGRVVMYRHASAPLLWPADLEVEDRRGGICSPIVPLLDAMHGIIRSVIDRLASSSPSQSVSDRKAATYPRPVGTFEAVADELAGVLEALGVEEDVVLVAGHMDWLGAMRFAERNRQHLRGLVLVDPILPWKAGYPSQFSITLGSSPPPPQHVPTELTWKERMARRVGGDWSYHFYSVPVRERIHSPALLQPEHVLMDRLHRQTVRPMLGMNESCVSAMLRLDPVRPPGWVLNVSPGASPRLSPTDPAAVFLEEQLESMREWNWRLLADDDVDERALLDWTSEERVTHGTTQLGPLQWDQVEDPVRGLGKWVLSLELPPTRVVISSPTLRTVALAEGERLATFPSRETDVWVMRPPNDWTSRVRMAVAGSLERSARFWGERLHVDRVPTLGDADDRGNLTFAPDPARCVAVIRDVHSIES